MSDYISREAAIKMHCAQCHCINAILNPDTCHKGCIEYLKFEEIPAADVRPVVKAEWFFVEELNEHFDIYCCKKCGAHRNIRKGELKPFFCEWCGADMRGSENGS